MRHTLLLVAVCAPLLGQVLTQLPIQSSSVASVPDPSTSAPALKPEDKCTIEGTVLNAATGEPLKKVTITVGQIGSRNNTGHGAVSDAAGHFKVENLDPGRYNMAAARTGFVNQQYGAKGPFKPGTLLTLTAGQNLKDADFKLTPQGVITGRVVDEDGDPIAHAIVQTEHYSYNRGRKQLVPAGGTNTDDLGQYRLFGLAPGRYYVAASHQIPNFQASPTVDPKKDFEEGYAPVYYPNARTADAAAPLEVTPGAQLRGIDLALAKTRTVRLRGHVTSSVTNKPVRANVSLTERESMGMGMRHSFSRGVDDKGSFEIHNVLPGSYVLVAQVYEDNKQSVAKVPIEVGSSNIDGLQIAVSPVSEVTGHVVVENNADTNGSVFNISLQSKIPGPFGGGGGAQAQKDGSFKIGGVSPDTYTVNVYGVRDNFYLKSVRLGDTDVTDAGVDFTQGVTGGEITVLMSTAGGQVDGTVQNDKSLPAPGAMVVLIPEAEKRTVQRLYKVANTDQNGSFSIKGIAPGDYKLFAWEQVDYDAYQDPDFLKPYESKGESISIKENGHETKQLKAIPADDTH